MFPKRHSITDIILCVRASAKYSWSEVNFPEQKLNLEKGLSLCLFMFWIKQFWTLEKNPFIIFKEPEILKFCKPNAM